MYDQMLRQTSFSNYSTQSFKMNNLSQNIVLSSTVQMTVIHLAALRGKINYFPFVQYWIKLLVLTCIININTISLPVCLPVLISVFDFTANF